MSQQQAEKQALARTKSHPRGYKYEPLETENNWVVVRVGSVEWRKWQ